MSVTLNDQQVIDIVNALLAEAGVRAHDSMRYLRERRDRFAPLRALAPVVDRYLAIVDPPRTCQVTHDHWEGPMICGRALPCPRHGGGR